MLSQSFFNFLHFTSVLLLVLSGNRTGKTIAINSSKMVEPILVKNIFLAEDDEDDVNLFNEVLLDITANVKVFVAENGKLLMDRLANSPLPEIIFLDLNMPLKNGLQCLKEIRLDRRLDTVKIVVLSTSNHKKIIESSYAEGADLFISKSISYTHFKETLGKCLQLELEQIKRLFNH